MANTTNLNLGKLSGSEKLKTFPTMQAGNMDAIDAAFGSGFGVGTASDVNSELNSLGDGLAIIANGNTHAAITAGQFVYVRKHNTLTDGLYTANSNISANETLSSSNLTADSVGGLNSVYASLNSKTNYKTIQDRVFNQLDANGNTATTGPSSYPSDPGIYRITRSMAGLPSGANVYGALIIFNAGTYWIHIYVNATNEFYYAYKSGTDAPTTWRKVTGTAVDPVT